MNWKKWLSYDAYKKLWSLIGGRPWTYISRDIWHNLEYFPLCMLVTVGFFSGLYWTEIVSFFYQHPKVLYAAGFGLFTCGYIFGHFFWGTKYIKHQQD